MPDLSSFDAAAVRELLAEAGAAWRARLTRSLEASLSRLPEEDEQILRLTVQHGATDEEVAHLLADDPSTDDRSTEDGLANDGLADDGLAGRRHTAEQIRERKRLLLRRLATDLDLDDLDQPGRAVEAVLALSAPPATRRGGRPEQPVQPPSPSSPPAHSSPVGSERPSARSDRRAQGGPDGSSAGAHRRRRGRGTGRRVPWAVGAIVLLLVLYGAVWAVGQGRWSEVQALAAVEPYAQDLQPALRSASADRQTRAPDAASASFARGARALRGAKTSTLGLFPRYDADSVRAAVDHLSRAYEQAEDPFARARSAFFLGKAHLMAEDVAAARRWFEAVLTERVALYREDARTHLRALPEAINRPRNRSR